MDLSPLPRDHLFSLFLNLYNTLVIHALCVMGPPGGAVSRGAFFSRNASYCIGGRIYTGVPPQLVWGGAGRV